MPGLARGRQRNQAESSAWLRLTSVATAQASDSATRCRTTKTASRLTDRAGRCVGAMSHPLCQRGQPQQQRQRGAHVQMRQCAHQRKFQWFHPTLLEKTMQETPPVLPTQAVSGDVNSGVPRRAARQGSCEGFRDEEKCLRVRWGQTRFRIEEVHRSRGRWPQPFSDEQAKRAMIQ